jgi:hypothetical protein
MRDTAKLIPNWPEPSGSPAGTVPLRRIGSDIRHDPATGDVIFSRKADSWDDFFELLKMVKVPKDFLSDRGDRRPQKRDLF